jgi:hypothetical protein
VSTSLVFEEERAKDAPDIAIVSSYCYVNEGALNGRLRLGFSASDMEPYRGFEDKYCNMSALFMTARTVM